MHRVAQEQGWGLTHKSLHGARVSSSDGKVWQTKPQADGAPWEGGAELRELELAPAHIALSRNEDCLRLLVGQSQNLEVCAACLQMAGRAPSFLGSWSCFPTSEKQIHSCSGTGCVFTLFPKTSAAPALRGINQPARLMANCCDIYHYRSGMASI